MAPSLNSTFSDDERLLRAFRRARYRVRGPKGDFVLRVDAASPELLDLFLKRAASSAVCITAHNPSGRRMDAAANDAAQAALRHELQALGLELIEGVERIPMGSGPMRPFSLPWVWAWTRAWPWPAHTARRPSCIAARKPCPAWFFDFLLHLEKSFKMGCFSTSMSS